jgi:hypothetical protein
VRKGKPAQMIYYEACIVIMIGGGGALVIAL